MLNQFTNEMNQMPCMANQTCSLSDNFVHNIRLIELKISGNSSKKEGILIYQTLLTKIISPGVIIFSHNKYLKKRKDEICNSFAHQQKGFISETCFFLSLF